jgi:hypothetical protein
VPRKTQKKKNVRKIKKLKSSLKNLKALGDGLATEGRSKANNKP